MAGAGNIPDDWGYSWVVDVANNGYDCWLTSWRGLGTSNKNIKDKTWSTREKWDFDWTPSAMIDIPAQIDVAIAVTGKEKVTLFGYSQGTAASLYGMVKNKAYYKVHVERAVMMAICAVPPTYG